MNRILIFILVVFTSCSSNNLLTYKYKRFFKEFNVIKRDSIFTLHQEVCYNRPLVVDEEYCYELKLIFRDVEAAKNKKVLDLQMDSAIVEASYGVFSVWVWNAPNNKVSGTIEILKWEKDQVILKENVNVFDFGRNRNFKFEGTRTFELEENDDK